jgi:hypothetical protein
VWVWEKPDPFGMYYTGADRAKEKDKTVIAVVRYDVVPHRLVKLTRVNRRPWPEMIEMFNNDTDDYPGVGEHDGTGIGNVIADMLHHSDSINKFVMIGRPRTQMLLDYVTDVEHGMYVLPHIPANPNFQGVTADCIYRAHRALTIADVYAPGKWNSHLPDEISAMALAHRALKKMPMPTRIDSGVTKSSRPRDVDKRFSPTGISDTFTKQGEVTIVDERYNGGSQLLIGSDGGRDMWDAMRV